MNFEEIMDFNRPYNKRNINSLIEKIKVNAIVPYVGAGMSMLFENVYPSWNGFLNNAFEEFIDSTEKTKFEKLTYEDKAAFLYREMGKITFAEYLKSTFGQQHLNRDLIDFIGKSAYLLPVIFEQGLLITTNYDKVLEKIYSLHGQILPVAHPGHFEALNGSLRDSELLLYKIHGDISEPNQSIILTSEQYKLAYKNPALLKALEQAYISKGILFLGCSITKDKPIEVLCKVSKDGINHYAIINCEENEVNARRLQLEQEYYTQAIIYPNGAYECVNVLLDYIAQNVNFQAYKKKMRNCDDTDNSQAIDLELVDEWFVKQNKIQIKNLGNRYLPDLNVELKIKNVFDSLSRNDCFYKNFMEKTDEVVQALKDTKLKCIEEQIRKICDVVNNFEIDSIESLDITSITNTTTFILQVIEKEISIKYEEMHKKENTISDGTIYYLKNAHRLVTDFNIYLCSSDVETVNCPFVLLYGEGGIGKSHIIADTINQRINDGKKSLLFLGQHFKDNNDPLNEMLKMLELDCSSECLFEKLSQIAERETSRIIIFIDALNEGNGKNIWKDYLPGIIEKIKHYPWLGLVVSIRTEYMETFFANNHMLASELVKIEHKGFSSLEYAAAKKYLEFYNIQYHDIPFIEQEFRNPLFLRLLCEAFKDRMIDLSQISFTDVYRNYLGAINLRISEICDYSRHINLVEIVISEMVLYKYSAGMRNNFIPLREAIEIIIGIEAKYNLKQSLLDELLSNGVITQNENYYNEECIYVTYEKLDDYLYAKLLNAELGNIGIEQFFMNHEELLVYPDILEALGIVLSEDAKYELFEIFEKVKGHPNVVSSFCNSLKWRKIDSINSNVINYINEIVLQSEQNFERLFDGLVLLSSKIGHCLNAEHTVENILDYPMPDRDAKFIPVFDKLYDEEGSSINRLLDWCLSKKANDDTLDETIRLTALMLTTFLISSNNLLRDKTTKALVNILNGRVDILISVLKKYEDVDDPYIIERLYAVAFGCVVSEPRSEKIKQLAIYVYSSFFKTDYVYPNMLLRDYAKSIVEYAKYRVVDNELLSLNIQPPYKSEFPIVPTDDEIKKYKLDYHASDFRESFWSGDAILSSMKVEYDREGNPGGYGDFGRYIFQSYFQNWKGLNYVDLKNIAIKKIFDIGYDVLKHGEYDRKITRERHRKGGQERIGKKYQWIALYELAAQVADNYEMEIHTNDHGGKKRTYCKGSFEPNLRNIDPTVVLPPGNCTSKKLHEKLFKFVSVSNDEWVLTFNDMPAVDDMVNYTYQNKNYMLLNGWYIWKESKKLSHVQYENPQKDMWVLINSYIVRAESYDKILNQLKRKNFMGRWLAEPNNNSHLFNKEYYWSDAHSFYKNSYYCGLEWTLIDSHSIGGKKEMEVLVPTCKYFTERNGDLIGSDNVASSWYKPCQDLFDKLNMKYGMENSILYDSKEEIVCFDSNELLKEDIGFFINRELIFEYLEKNNYKIFWTVLAEKRIISEESNSKKHYAQPSISGIFTLDTDGNLYGEFNQFED